MGGMGRRGGGKKRGEGAGRSKRGRARARAAVVAPHPALSFSHAPPLHSFKATYRLIGTGAAAPQPAGTADDLVAALVSGSAPPGALARVAVLRAATAFVPLKSAPASRRRLLLGAAADNATSKGTPLTNMVDVLVQADAGAEAGVQATYDAVRAAAYAGTLQGGLRAAGWPWAVVLTAAVAAKPGDAWPAPDDWCRARLGAACLDGSGLSGAGAKGLIAAGAILILLGTALALVAADRRRAGRAGGARMSSMLTGTVPGGGGGGGQAGAGPVVGAVAAVSVGGGGGEGGKTREAV